MQEKKMMSLDDVGHGSLREMFNIEMVKVARNIKDPNTDPKKPRKITMTVTFVPEESRQTSEIKVSAVSTLAPRLPFSSVMMIGQDIRTGAITMSEFGNSQNVAKSIGEATVVQAEEIPPVKPFDRSTGEIYDTAVQAQSGPIDLRAAN